MGENKQNAALRELGALLRATREEAGKTQRTLASEAGFPAHSRISDFEKGKVLPTSEEINRLIEALNVTDTDRHERIRNLMVQAAEGPSVLQVGHAVIDETLVQLVDHENAAERITVVGPLLLPGLIQTAEYAKRIYGDSSGAAQRVALRVLRREILTRRSNPVDLIALVDSEALLRPVLPPDMLVDQLHHILDLATRANVTVQIVSSTVPGYHPMLSGQFELIEFPTASPIVLLDHYHASAFLRDPVDVAVYVQAAEFLRKEVAMSPDESIELIKQIVQGMERE